MNPTTYSNRSATDIELKPSYILPIAVIIIGIGLLLVQPWLSLIISSFGLFLLFQTVIIRLKFTATSMEVYRSDTLIRRFPYQDWLNWRIFFHKLPILFYFKEVNSIHFLPIIFDSKMLQSCLEERCPKRQGD